jgi:hypothetical protein
MKIDCKNTAPADRVVDLSDISWNGANVLPSFGQISHTRDTRVQMIKMRIDAGIYTVEPSKVAESILRSMNNSDGIKSILTQWRRKGLPGAGTA